MPEWMPGVSYVDLEFRGKPRAVATAVVRDAGGVALVDPGPTSCLAALERGLGTLGLTLDDVSDVLLTHVHLDHAGATGTLCRRNPRLRVHVHERGVRHLVEPGRLIESATRLYGDEMDALWGEIAPVPASCVVSIGEGDEVVVGRRRLAVAYTPGHAVHHVSFLDHVSGTAFVGDVAGIRSGGSYVRPPTPPPDIDVDHWLTSVDRIRVWKPSGLFVTHFGPSADVEAHLASFETNLRDMSDMVRCSLAEPGDDAARATRFAEYIRAQLVAHLSPDDVAPHHVGASFEVSWWGLARYWRKRGALA